MVIRKKDIKRFWSKVDKKLDRKCWNWIAYKDRDGYGQIWFNRKMLLAHRFSWMIHFDSIPEGLLVCHKCDNKSCVNPNHLFLGTNKDNTKDMFDKGRASLRSGENQIQAKLTYRKVKKIISLYRTKKYLQREIGIKFGVSQPTISNILNSKTWSKKQ